MLTIVGKLIYDSTGQGADIEDRTLAHLRVVIMNKLRRGEAFMFHYELADGSLGHRSIWMHPTIPLTFHFYGGRPPQINRAWVEALMESAGSANGLSIVPEPDDAAREGRPLVG